jgi:hypothetical protein
MTYAYKDYWADIRPVYDHTQTKVLYWRYEIFAFTDDDLIFDGHDGDRASALSTAQAHIEALVRDDAFATWKAA